MSLNTIVVVRDATSGDAQGIAAVHHAAVFQAGAGTYPPEVLKHWSGPLNKERIETIRAKITEGSRHYIVALVDDAVVGFSSIDLESSELGGAFVTPNFGREGIGSQLIAALEEMAIEKGLTELSIDASLNAEKFYAEHGYESLGPMQRKLSDDTTIPMTRMRKHLPEST